MSEFANILEHQHFNTTSKKFFFLSFILLFVCVTGYLLLSKSNSQKDGLLFGIKDYYPKKGIVSESAVIVSLNGKRVNKYRNQKYISRGVLEQDGGFETDELSFSQFEKATGLQGYLYQSAFDTKKENLIFRFARCKNRQCSDNQELWSFNTINKSFQQISSSTKKLDGCNWIINWLPDLDTLIMGDVVDMWSTLEIGRLCKIHTKTGDITDILYLNNKERLRLIPYFIDNNSKKMLINTNLLVDFLKFDVSRIKVPNEDNFEIESEGLKDGFLLVKAVNNDAVNLSNFFIYNLRNDTFSDKIQINKAYASLVDISPDNRYVLFSYFVRDNEYTKKAGVGGNGYSCYVLFDKKTFTQGKFCSTDLGLDGVRKGFIGWVQI